MAKPAAKFAVSLPQDLYRALEQARRRGGKSRSAVVQEAVRDWLGREARADLVREYVAGYRRKPETEEEAEAALATAAPLLRDEDW
jgi:Arc/MetJ-type ribon-helix-helix transcriptional regulator